MIERRPRAPVSRSIALSAIASSESGAKTSSMSSKSKRRSNCLVERVLGLGQDRDQVLAAELVDRGEHRQPADELRDQAELHQVLGEHLTEQLADLALLLALHRRAEADAVAADPLLDHLVELGERAAADEQDVRRVDGEELLVGMLAAALRGDRGGRALEDLEQRLLDALAGDVTRDRRVVGLARDLVDLVDVDDPRLRLLDVVVGGLDQLQEDVLDVLADVAGLRQRRRVGDREGDVEDPRERLGEQRLAAAGRAEQQDVRLLQLGQVGCRRRCSPRRPSARACSGCRRRPRAPAWRRPGRRRTRSGSSRSPSASAAHRARSSARPSAPRR